MRFPGLGSKRGFTLLELLISLAIFSLIGLATVKQIQQIQTTKDEAFLELDSYNNIRAALSLIRFDVSQAFHVLYDDLSEEARQAITQNQPVAHTIFDGRKDQLIFTALSHRVYYSGVKECEQTEISYFLQKKEGAKTPSLMKRESPMIDDDLYQGGSAYTVLDGVDSLVFEYWDEKIGKWVGDWNSDGGEYRDRFPLAVKVKLRVLGRKSHLKVETEVKPAFPNNNYYVVQF